MPTLVEPQSKVPKYLKLADHLRFEIDCGNLAPHDRLPSFTEMKARFDATQRTVEKAHTLLETEGLIRREQGRGAFVNDRSKRPTSDFIAFVDFKPARQTPYVMEVLKGIREKVQSCGKSIAMVDDLSTFKHWKLMDGAVLEHSGLITPPGSIPDFPKNMPLVRLYYPEPGISSVMADDEAGVTMAMEHLLDLGHRRIGYLINLKPLENHQTHPLLKTRYRAYRNALEERGITPDTAWTSKDDITEYLDHRDFGYHVMRQWLDEGWRELGLTAMLTQNDSMAIGMIRALEERDIRVPDDVSIVGFDGLDTSAYATLPLTTIVVPLYEIGATAMRVLADHINDPNRPCETIKLGVRLHVGESTKPLST